jgi:hypothetical protein
MFTIGDVLNHKAKPMPKPKKINFRQMQQFDLEREECFVRLIEMEVDGVLHRCKNTSATQQTGISVQFWRDVTLYGIDEALAYFKNYLNGEDVDYTDLEKAIADMRKAMETPA